MKNFTPFKLLVILMILFQTENSNAQITISAGDFEPQLELGNIVTTYLDTTTPQFNVGNAGQNTWDLTGLSASNEFDAETKNKATSPYAGNFPDAEYASNYAGVFAGVYSNSWVYVSVTSDFLTHGTGTVANSVAGDIKTVIKYTPAWVEYKFPINLGDMNTYTGTQTIKNTVTVPIVGEVVTNIEQEITVEQEVDGYGTVTFPDGKKLNALRIVEKTTFNNDGNITTSTVIKLLTKTGEIVQFTPSVENEITGTVGVENISWTSGSGESITEEIPAAPSDLMATAGLNSIELSWTDNSDNEVGFSIERTIAGGLFVFIGNTASGVTTFTDSSVIPGVDYSYRVRAYNNDTLSAYSATVNASIEIQTIDAPSDLIAAADENNIELSWTDNSDNEDGFYIERASLGGGFMVIELTAAGTTSYIDTDVMAGVEYSYRIQAFNNDTVSPYSATAMVTIEILSVNAPSDLYAIAGESSIDLSWTDNSDNETGYYIERASAGSGFTVIDSMAANSTSYTDSDVMLDVEYSYRVQAYNNDTTSEFSNSANAEITTTGNYDWENELNGYSLRQNYPNPFSSKTTISFQIAENEKVMLSVLNMDGKVVRIITNETLQRGEHLFDFYTEGLESGTYFYQIKTARFAETKSLLIVK